MKFNGSTGTQSIALMAGFRPRRPVHEWRKPRPGGHIILVFPPIIAPEGHS